MRTIIYDFDKKYINKFIDNEKNKFIAANECKNSCVGYFSCWVKHPKKCIYKDLYYNIVEYLKDSDELVLISKSKYGCYSKEIKKVLERSIGYVLPYFTIRNGMIHHESRYNHTFKLSVYFYGNINEEERKCLYELVNANSINLNADSFSVNYLESLEEIENVYFD